MRNYGAYAGRVACLLVAAVALAAFLEPPEQHDPARPPTSPAVPPYVVKVAATLFDAGLADPRGGDYREVDLAVQTRSGALLKTHAWVFPGAYAVTWNGLVYRVASVGGKADLDADVRTIVSAGPWSGRIQVTREPPAAKARFWFDMELGQTLAPVSICLLLRLRRADLAGLLWQAPESANNLWGIVSAREHNEGRWLATAATAWFGTAYWRLTLAFERGDDREVVEVAKSILQWRSRVPDKWREQNHWVPRDIPDISFLDPVPALMADSHRRLREPARPPLDLRPIAHGKGDPTGFLKQPQPVRIAALVQRLDEVRGHKTSIPGTLAFFFDPTYELLKKEGESAVDALLDAYETDQRLIRSLDSTRPWHVERKPVPVRDVIQSLLGDILRNPDLVQKSTPAELRSWWRTNRSRSRAVRAKSSQTTGPRRLLARRTAAWCRDQSAARFMRRSTA